MGNVNTQDKDGCSQLHHAAIENNAIKAIKLIKNGAEINLKDKCNLTPLHYAA